jgi:hypothetical protein
VTSSQWRVASLKRTNLSGKAALVEENKRTVKGKGSFKLTTDH